MTKTNKRAAFIPATSNGVFCRVSIKTQRRDGARTQRLKTTESIRIRSFELELPGKSSAT
ncbi:MAG: hypothetical protein U9N12_09670 [Euryarchaeota archaeon]|nr:hypothetical protein [Euryarchaeota archaeon]